MNKFIEKLKYHEKQILTEMAYGFSTTAQPITQAELVEKIKGLTDADKPVRFTSVTDATYVKSAKRNTIGTVYKVSQVDGLMNVDYASRKQQKLDTTAPGTTYAPGKTYGTHLTGSVIEHNGKHYIMVLPEDAQSPRFVVKNNIGQFAEKDKADVAAVLPPPRTGVSSDEVGVRKYSASSIVAVEVDGQSYIVSDADPDRKAVLDIVNSTKAL
jgi:hypothetical protein